MSIQPTRRLSAKILNRKFSMTAALGLIVGAMAAGPVLAEKPPLDFNAFDDWPLAEGADLSTDGHYGLYVVSHQRKDATNTVVIQGLQGGWKMETEVSGSAQITRDGRMAVFIQPPQTLCLVTLGTSSVERITHVGAFRLVKRKGGEWLVYQLDDIDKRLLVRDLAGRATKSFAGVVNHWFSRDGESLVLQTASGPAGEDSGEALQSLQWVRLSDGTSVTFWRGGKISDLTFDANNTQLAFMSEDKADGHAQASLWYYRVGTDKAVMLVNNRSPGIDDNLRIGAVSSHGFSRDGGRIFLTVKEQDYATPKPGAVKVDIWSYKDPRLQSEQLRELTPISREEGGPRSFLAVVPIQEPRVIRLQWDDEIIDLPDEKTRDIALLSNLGNGNREERNWNPTTNATHFLISTKDGKRKPIALMNGLCSLSPDGKYILVEDELRRNMFSYEVDAGAVHDLTRHLPIPLIDNDFDNNALPPPRGISHAAWLDHDAVLIYDQYDLWRLDLTGRRAPFNVTGGFGRRHNIEFRLARDYKSIGAGDRLLLTAFNRQTKDSGFYSLVFGQKADPRLLTMGPYSYGLADPWSSADLLRSDENAKIHLVWRSSAAEAPNYFYTRDFRAYTPLSHVYPERAYNWLTTELLTWKAANGRSMLGVLYKPENFDPGRKYPVIFHYYEKKSDDLNKYPEPQAISGSLNIPWFVSHGYLVFTPDIHYAIGHPGSSTADAVVSAARYLATFPWVDAKKMGIQGHSWGGFETNYIVTHTPIFAAAMSSSGISDFVSDYDSIGLGYTRSSKQFIYETGQGRIGPTPWQRPDLYIENSAIFQADKVSTPLLMMSNKEDGVVPFAQGVEFFVALRRLGKKVWMLQYDGEGHSLRDDEAKRQHTIRVTQFFDHYLKGSLPPKWMTEGIPAKLKGVDTGLELDSSGEQP